MTVSGVYPRVSGACLKGCILVYPLFLYTHIHTQSTYLCYEVTNNYPESSQSLLEYKLVYMRVKLEGSALSQPYKKTIMKEERKGTVKIIIGFTSLFIDLFSKPLLSTHMCQSDRHDYTLWTQPSLIPALWSEPPGKPLTAYRIL